MRVLGVDVGGSAVKAAVVDTATGELLDPARRYATPTPLAPLAMARVIAGWTRELHWRGAIGIGCPGIIDRGRVTDATNLHPRFARCAFERLVATETGCRVALINDAAAAALAEVTFGAGRNRGGLMLMLTLGTGVGSALVCRGVSIPCELGQLQWDGQPAEQRVAASIRTREGLSWAEWGMRLNRYLAMVEELICPERIIIGGGVSAEHRRFFRYVHCRAKLAPATLRNDAGIIGAALAAVSLMGDGASPANSSRAAAAGDA